jgi:ribonuclease HI
MKEVIVYTDGSILKNPGNIGGWGGIIISTEKKNTIVREYGSYLIQEGLTSVRCEIIAFNETIRKLDESCHILAYIDCGIVGDVISGRVRAKTNLDLFRETRHIIQKHKHTHDVQWVKGHNGNIFNEKAHNIAKFCAKNADVHPTCYQKHIFQTGSVIHCL